MSLLTTYAFDPGAAYQSAIVEPINAAVVGPGLGLGNPEIPRRQLQITTTITPTITRGVATAAIPTRTDPRGRPVPSAATTSSAEKDDSLFPSNLSWWQILGIAIAGVVLFGIVAYIFISRRNKAKLAAVKAKAAEVEEGRKARDLDDAMPRGGGMGGMGMGGLGMGMGLGMGGMPMMYAQNDGVGGGGGRRKRNKKKRYDSSDSESYDDVSDGGTIKRRRRKRRGGRRKDDYSSDETLSSAVSSSYYARPTKSSKDRRRNEKENSRERDRRRQDSSRTPKSRGDEYPLGLGPSTTGLPTGSTRKSPGRKGSMKRFQDSVFSTFDSMTNKAAKLEALKKKAVEATLLDQQLKLREALAEEDRLERERRAKIRDANEQIRVEEAKEKAKEEFGGLARYD
jgi:hypothetical protein